LDVARAELDRALFDTETIVENLSSGLVTIDAQGIVCHWNRAAADILGQAARPAHGVPYEEALGPGYEEFRDRLKETLVDGAEGSRFEASVTTPAKRRVPLGISTSLLLDPDGARRGVVALFQDLSEVKAREERSRRRETLAAIGELSAGIAHEIRNCLNPISGSVEVLQKELHVEGENARLFDLIIRESERLDAFIRELLEYARERPLKTEVLAVGAFLQEIVELARRHPSATELKTVALSEPDPALLVEADAEQLKQVLMNLLINGLEAIEESGAVDVRVAHGRERRRTRRGGSTEHLICVEIQDSGVGIAAADLNMIFEPFYSTKRGGTGLGLAIANRIVERHGGTLEAESRVGAGTTMRVWLPRAERIVRTVARAA
jgi:PAS domain S-box-containing protein